MTSKARQKRTINNPIVDIDDVFIGRGDAYVNWIGIAKHKLYKREVALLQQRREASDTIIGRMIKLFARNQSHLFEKHNLNAKEFAIEATATRIYQQQLRSQIMDPNSSLITRYMESIQKLLTPWNGYHPKKTINSFREYFQQCRGWLDRTKLTKMAHTLWIPMMRLIEEVSYKAASQTFDQEASRVTRVAQVYGNYLKTWLFLGLVEHQIKPSNCAHRWLIPATVYKTLYPTLAIQPEDVSKTTDLRLRYLRAIEGQIESLKQSFETELAMLYTQRARDLQAQQSDDVIMSCTNNQFNKPYYPMVRNNETPPQPPPFFPCVNHRRASQTFYTQHAITSHTQLTQQSDDPQDTHLNTYSAFQSNAYGPCPYPMMIRPPPLSFHINMNTSVAPEMVCEANHLNDPYHVMCNIETQPSPGLLPLCTCESPENSFFQLDMSHSPNYY